MESKHSSNRRSTLAVATLLALAAPANAPSVEFDLAGISLDRSGLLVFRKARTTINPLSPDKSTAIVQGGPYAFTRNPMYLGMALILLGHGVFLANALSLVAVAIFCAYITAFQIIPEERLLLRKFGDGYASYMAVVRRWI